MPSYRVTWEIDIDADSPLEAAKGDTVFYDRRPMLVTKRDLPGEYGPRVELGGRIITTVELDHRATMTADEPQPPSLSSLLWGGQ